MKTTFDTQTIEINPSGDHYAAVMDGETIPVQIVRAENGRMDLLINDQRVSAHVRKQQKKLKKKSNGFFS